MLPTPFRAVVAVLAMLAPAIASAQPAAGNGQPSGPPPSTPPNASAAGGQVLQTFNDKLSYAVGLNAGRRLQQQGISPDQKLYIRGFMDSYKKGPALLSDQEIRQIFAKVQQEMRKQVQQRQQQRMAQWKQAFASKPVAAQQKTASGLQYTIYQKGEGPKPGPNDFVVVNYVGKFPNGEVFDSSIARGEPAVFKLGGQIIQGWKEGLPLMSKGAKFRFAIPSELAYGKQGLGDRIPPNQDLVFEVELLDFGSAQQPATGAGGAATGANGSGQTTQPRQPRTGQPSRPQQ